MEIMSEIPGWLWWGTAVISGLIASYFKDIIDFVFSKLSKSVSKRIELSEKRKDEIAQIIKGSEFEKIIYSNSITQEYLKAVFCIVSACVILAILSINLDIDLFNALKSDEFKRPKFLIFVTYSGLLLVIALLLMVFQLISNIIFKISVIRRLSKID